MIPLIYIWETIYKGVIYNKDIPSCSPAQELFHRNIGIDSYWIQLNHLFNYFYRISDPTSLLLTKKNEVGKKKQEPLVVNEHLSTEFYRIKVSSATL